MCLNANLDARLDIRMGNCQLMSAMVEKSCKEEINGTLLNQNKEMTIDSVSRSVIFTIRCLL